MSKRPHVIIFNPDEMRTDTMFHMGENPAAQTPFLDEFIETEAVSFRNAFCQNPVCVPSRCSFFTGLYPHVHGHRTMQHLLHGHESNLFSELKAAGYYVWMNTRNDLVAGQEDGLFESQADEIFYGSRSRGNGTANPNPRGQMGDKNYYSHFTGRLLTDENGINYSSDDAVVDAAIARMKDRKDDRPLCMFLGLGFPHTPYGVEEPYFSAIDRSKLPRRAGIGTNKPLMEAELRKNMAMDEYTEEDWDEMRAVYLGMCMKIDAQFRRLCQGLKDAGIYDDTLIVFLSDHGDYTGDYGIPEKAQNTFEDCLTRVPLVIKPPKGEAIDPGITDSLTELVDFYTTVMDYAGVEPDHDNFGNSLRGVVADRSTPNKDYVFCEGGRMPYEKHCDEYHSVCGASGIIPKGSMYWPRQTAQTNDEAHCKGTMIRDDKFKYVHRITGANEFYDLEKDPLEEHNVYGQPEYAEKVLEMRMAMLDWYQATCDIVPKKIDQRNTEYMFSRNYGHLPEDVYKAALALYREGTGGAAIGAHVAKMMADRAKG